MILPLLLLIAKPPNGVSCTIGVSAEIVAPVSAPATTVGFTTGPAILQDTTIVHRTITTERIEGRPYKLYTLVIE